MSLIKIGLIGVGYLGKIHLKLLKINQNIDFIGFHEVDEVISNQIANEFLVKSFPNLAELIDLCDGLVIVTPTSTHYEIAKKCLEKGKHIFLEKPITTTIHEAEEIVKLANEKNLKIQVGHIERFNSALLSLEKFLLEPKFIQTDRLAQFNPRGSDVAVVLDLMIHDIDIILSLVKSEVKDIKASGVSVVSDNLDIANARIEFENGAVANVTASRISQKKMRKMRIFQRDAYLSLDFTNGTSEVFRLIEPNAEIKGGFINFGEIGVGEKKKFIIYEQPEQVQINAMQHEQNLFVKSISENSRPAVNGEDGLQALRVAELILNKINESSVLWKNRY